MRTTLIFTLLLVSISQVRGEPPECLAPDSEDTEMLLETIAGGPVSFSVL